ncbi:hypothetical protein ABIQ69_16285 [Agromyces sp. G08B096]|uniref:Uncharacterized protein n=1 Tax=Agromyces sp. G08B096 TaxID=3156399 RepID=A0AAU7W654_9MICO
MPLTSSRQRAALILVVACAAALVVGVLAAMPPKVDRLVALLPPVPGTAAGLAFLALCALAVAIAALRRLATVAACRNRRAALEQASPHGAVACGIRHGALTAALAELGVTARVPSRFSVLADRAGLSFWTGGRRPRRVLGVRWSEVRSIRSDRLVAGASTVPVVVLRIRRDGASVEVPVLLGAERPGAFALGDADFYATVRTWKAEHRAALAAEGLELPPLTAPIPVITSAQLVGAGR